MPVVAFCRVVGVDPRSGVLGGNKMLRHMSRVVAPRLAACSAAVGTMATIAGMHSKEAAESIAAPPANGKLVQELSFSVSSAVAGDFNHWLSTHLKTVLELPGMLGAKVMQPVSTTVDAAPAKPGVIFVLGGPGAGKGTQCGRIVEKYGYTHLSAGDLLREERKSGSEQGQMIEEYIKEGKIVPVEVTVKLLLNAIAADGGKRFLIDGFPRNTNNLSGWQQVAGESLALGGVLFYDCPEETMEARLLERGKTSGRTDDNIESIRKRFKTYQNETMPILGYYDHQGLCYKINGARDVEEVWRDTQEVIEKVESQVFAAAPAASDADCSVCAHVYCSAEETAPTDLVARMAAAAEARFGKGAVGVSGRVLRVDGSMKAFDMDALRAFD